MIKNKVELLVNLEKKVEEWKNTQNKEDMKSYFREIFIGDIFFENYLDHHIDKLLNYINKDIFDIDRFLEMNYKYPSQFHAYIFTLKPLF